MLWKRGALEQRCTETGQNSWKIPVRQFLAKVADDAAFLKLAPLSLFLKRSLTLVSTGSFCEHYCLEQLVLYHFSDCDSLKNKQGFFKSYVMANYLPLWTGMQVITKMK